MKIKMLRYYHGQLSNDEHLRQGEEYDLKAEAAKELIDRDFAMEAKASSSSKSSSGKGKPANVVDTEAE